MKKTTKILLVVVGLLIACIAGYSLNNKTEPVVGGVYDNVLSDCTMSHATTSKDDSVKLLSADPGRQYAAITNNSTTTNLSLHFGTASTTFEANRGIRINPAGSSYEIVQENLWIGEVWTATTTETTTVMILDCF